MTTPPIDRPAGQRVVPTDRARQGEVSGHVRLVLQASLLLAVLAGVVLWYVA